MNRWRLACGTFFFQHRNRVFPLLMLAGILGCRPRFPGGNYQWDLALDVAGLLVCLAGQTLRALTIGYDYIKRGGKQQQIWAGRLVTGGGFSHTRNPLYLGNILIFSGIVLIFSSPAALLIGLPAVLFIYDCIIAAEERFLRDKFGAEYEDYAQNVRRLWPNWHGFFISIDGLVFRWRRVVNKEYGTTFAWILAAISLRAWTLYRINDGQYHREIVNLILLLVPVAGLYSWARWMKKTGRLAEEDFATVDG